MVRQRAQGSILLPTDSATLSKALPDIGSELDSIVINILQDSAVNQLQHV